MKLKIQVPSISAILLMIFSFATLAVGAQGKKSMKDEHCMLLLGLDNYRTLAVEVRGGKLRSFEQFPFLASPQREGWVYFYPEIYRAKSLVRWNSFLNRLGPSCMQWETPEITSDKKVAYNSIKASPDTFDRALCEDNSIHISKAVPNYFGGGLGAINWRSTSCSLFYTKTIMLAEIRSPYTDTVTNRIYYVDQSIGLPPLHYGNIEHDSIFSKKELSKYKQALFEKGEYGQVNDCPYEMLNKGSEGECSVTIDTSTLDLDVVHNEGQWKWRLRARPKLTNQDNQFQCVTVSIITTPLSPQYAPYNSFNANYKKLEEKMFRRDILVKNMFLSPGGEHLFVYTGDALYGFTYPSLRLIFEQPLDLPAGTKIVSSEWSYGPAMEKWWEALLPDKE